MTHLSQFSLMAWLVCALLAAIPLRLVAHGDLHERIDTLTQKLEADVGNAEWWLQRADLRREHQEYESALADLEKAGQLKPGWPAVHLQLARICFGMGNYPEVVRHATDCLKLDALNADAHVIRARSYAKLKEFSKAVADYDAVLSLTNGPRPLPDLFLERARAQAALEHWDDVIRGLDDGMKRLGETPSFALPAIEYERQRRAFEAALARLERAKKFFNPEAFLALRGEILLQAGRRAEAQQDFQTALDALGQPPTDHRASAQVVELESRLRAGLKQARVSSAP